MVVPVEELCEEDFDVDSVVQRQVVACKVSSHPFTPSLFFKMSHHSM